MICDLPAPVYGLNAAHTRSYCGTQFDGTIRSQWATDTGGINEFPPSVRNGVAYLAQDNGRVSAFRVQDGDKLWTVNLHSEFSDTPSVGGNGSLYVASRGRNSGLWRIRTSDGKVQAHANVGQSESSPVVFRHRVVLGTTGGQLISYTLDLHRRWARSGLGKITGSPAIQRGIYIATYGGWVYRFTIAGRQVWKRHVGGTIYAGLAVQGSRLLVPDRDRGSVIALRTGTGVKEWERYIGTNVYGSVAVGGGAVYATWRGSKLGGTSGGFAKLALGTGRILWRHPVNVFVMSSPVIVGSRVFFSTMGPNFTRGYTVGYSTATMWQTFTFKDGRYTPVVPTADTLLLVGMRTLYGFRR